ncbi:DNA-binding response regulator [Caballeronia novacaledonica]|uniref:DNA-binding response regulator n=1 Tax=Caballeronia novacaledonica TaxID=1544861 RepID=A0A2U3I5J5_9BURK|nr:response regulator transcription factor [Caballeronia novacaledonica]SPB15434.1 DNA-binding response regulator [Caballeronia novacaledonica]
MGKTRIAIVDDHPLILSGLRKTFESSAFDVVGAFTEPAQLLQMLSDEPCDVVVADYSMPGDQALDGWRFLASVSSEFPNLRVLVYTEFDDPFLVGSLVKRGVAGIVSKRDEMQEVLAATHSLAQGDSYLSPVANASLERFNVMPEYQRFMALTRRQMEVTGLMLCGLSVCETARLLRRRINTISTQRTEACRRLGFSGESEVYRFAIDHRLWLDRSTPGIELRPA